MQITVTPFVDEWYARFSADGGWPLFTASSLAGRLRDVVAGADASEQRPLVGGLFSSRAP